MSNMFEMPNINEDKVRYFQMNTNVLAGFKTAVAQGQPNLALSYLQHVIDILAKKVEACTCGQAQEETVEEEETPKPAKTKLTKTVDATE